MLRGGDGDRQDADSVGVFRGHPCADRQVRRQASIAFVEFPGNAVMELVNSIREFEGDKVMISPATESLKQILQRLVGLVLPGFPDQRA
jgi:hypothetical protein